MAEYIEKSKVRQAVKQYFKKRIDDGNFILDIVDTSVSLCLTIKDMPAADVTEIKYGLWKKSFDNGARMHECSLCGARVVKGVYEYENPNRYCYYCGAKMDVESKVKE